jgi:1-acyl-sn-glycerol-3-phosphate acyltransferase
VIYPEGTLTRDPGLWPMKGKTGAARIALATGCPVIPVGQWGAHEILPPYTKTPHLVPRKNVVMKAGDPVPLDDLVALPPTPETTAMATDRIMSAITGIVADLRGETPPAERYDPRATGVREIGNPHEEAQRARHRPRKKRSR